MRKYHDISLDESDRLAVAKWFRWSLITYTSAALTLALLVASGGARNDVQQPAQAAPSSAAAVSADSGSGDMPTAAVGAPTMATSSWQGAMEMAGGAATDTRAMFADPAINAFVGLSENAWDFNAPDSIPGFGSMLSPEAAQPVETARLPGSRTQSAHQ